MWHDETTNLNEDTVTQTVKDALSYITTTRSYLTSILSVLTSYTQISAYGSQVTLTVYQNSVISAKATVDSAYTTITNDVQAVNNAQSALNQANAALALKESPARTEDLAIAKAQVESTQGALQIAQAAYDNTIITAPIDGTILSVSISAGQIATANTAAIEISSK
jgi:multidrug resistance efflux pump